MRSFARDGLTALLERRAVVQGTLLRSTIHFVSAEDYWPFAIGIRRARRDWLLRTVKGVTAGELDEAAGRLRAALAGGPLRRADLDKLIEPRLRIAVGGWLDMVRVPPSGTWERRRADLYGLAEQWLGPGTATEDEGLDLLVRRYLAGFGPATRAEIGQWAALPVASVAPVLERLRLRRFRAEDGAELLDLPRAPLPDPAMPVPVRYLPTWDATLLVHARRTGILPEEYRPRIFSTRTPHSFPTFLVDGAVAGTWRYERGRIERTEFHPLDRAVRRELDDEADRLVAFHA